MGLSLLLHSCFPLCTLRETYFRAGKFLYQLCGLQCGLQEVLTWVGWDPYQQNFVSLHEVWLYWFFLSRGSTIQEINLHCRIKVNKNLVQSCDNLHRVFRKLILFSPTLLATHKDGTTPEHEKACTRETLIILHKVIALYMCPAGALLWSELGSGLKTCRTLTKGPVHQGEPGIAQGLPENIQHLQKFPSPSCWATVTDLLLQDKTGTVVLWLLFPVCVAGPHLPEHTGFP